MEMEGQRWIVDTPVRRRPEVGQPLLPSLTLRIAGAMGTLARLSHLDTRGGSPVTWKKMRHAMEPKLRRGPDTEERALRQTNHCLDTAGRVHPR